MRRSQFRPMFDRLDARVVLSDASGIPMGAAVGTAAVATTTPDDPGDDVVNGPGWYVGTGDSGTTYDPDQPEVPVDYVTVATADAN